MLIVPHILPVPYLLVRLIFKYLWRLNLNYCVAQVKYNVVKINFTNPNHLKFSINLDLNTR